MDNKNEAKEQNIFKADNQRSSTSLEPNLAGLLCYLAGVITGVIFLIIEKENRFVRFHAIQSIMVFVVIFVLSLVLSAIPLIGWLLSLLLSPVSLVLWIFLMWKAYQNEWFKLPVIGDLAEKQLNK